MVLVVLILLSAMSLAAIRTFTVKEGNFVKIKPQVTDPDNDNIKYTYSPPLDQQGEWQTTLDDEGEYTITITADDGTTKTQEKVKIIVEHKNQPPELSENKIIVKETQTVDLKSLVTDPDEDPLTFQFKAPFDSQGKWKTDYNDAGTLVTEFTVSDGTISQNFRVEIETVDTNQPPILEEPFSEERTISATEDETLSFGIKATDLNNDKLTFTWKFDDEIISNEETGGIYLDFNSAGQHSLTVNVSDGIMETSREWNINVANINRAPEFSISPITVNEGEKIFLELPEKDADGDAITYSFPDLFNDKGEWQTDHEDAGDYNLEITASDRKLTHKEKFKVTITDVDRAPSLNVPNELQVKEGETASFAIETDDSDGDKLTITAKNLPDTAVFDAKSKTVTWGPDYDAVKQQEGKWDKVLYSLHLERFFLQKKEWKVNITSCGKQLCASKKVPFIVRNVNRQPVLKPLSNITITETETVVLKPEAADPDGDPVQFSFSSPLGKFNGKWKTDFNDAGKYTAYIAASDRRATTTIPVGITVLQKNQRPTIKVDRDEVSVPEGQKFSLKVKASDPDDDNLTVTLGNMPPGASFKDGVFTWKPEFETVNGSISREESFLASLDLESDQEKETVELEFKASDGEFEVIHPVKILVENVNQKPEIIDYLPKEVIRVKPNTPVEFHAAVKDLDNDKLDLEWDFGFGQNKITDTDTIRRTFTTPGVKTIKFTASDGEENVEREWTVQVLQVKRVPVNQTITTNLQK